MNAAFSVTPWLLSPVLAGEQTIDEIILNPLGWYADHGITLHAGWKVTSVDRVRRVVHACGDVSIADHRHGNRARHRGDTLKVEIVEKIVASQKSTSSWPSSVESRT
jgi:hypothetical protein